MRNPAETYGISPQTIDELTAAEQYAQHTGDLLFSFLLAMLLAELKERGGALVDAAPAATFRPTHPAPGEQ